MVRRNLSRRNKYYISKERAYELQHFCFQYDELKSELAKINVFPEEVFDEYIRTYDISDPTYKLARKRLSLINRITMIEEAAKEATTEFYKCLLIGVTKNVTYDILVLNYGLLCSEREYYTYYRRFLKILSDKRD